MNDHPTKNIELYAKDEEIARLKSEVEMMTVQAIKFRDMALSHRALLVRAASTLEFYVDPEIGVDKAFIAELRKAAHNE